MTDDFTVLDNFQSYVEKTELFRQFDNKNVVLYHGRIYEVGTYSHSLELLAVTSEDIKTGIMYSTNFGHQGLTRIITDQDRQIFDECTRLAHNIKEKIIEQAAQVKINEFKIIHETKTEN